MSPPAAPAAPDDPLEQWRAAGLYDPHDPGAPGRLALLRWISGHGVTIPQMQQACADGQLNALVGDLSLRPGPRRSPRDVARMVDMDLALVHDVRQAAGLPPVADDDAELTDDDVQMLRLFHEADGFFSRDELLRLATVMGASLRRVADAAGEMFLRDVEAPLKANGPTFDLEMAQLNLAGIQLARAATGVFAPMFLAHLEFSTYRTRRARRDSEDYETVPLAVGFVDLSGFTERSSGLAPAALRDLIVQFEDRAHRVVHQHDGRVVKLIGDEVMFSAVDASAVCAIALALTAAAPEGTSARGGLAYGPVIASGGDLYGPVVNLASRIADIAIPGEVLVNDAIAQSVPARVFEPAGRRRLKGFSEPVRLWTLTG
ncbi:MAG: adenylate cyclase regulatory domain-containing protein [Actinomycetota bacterium]|nr:adenylate cyclase regulatory domain-containing protein [Actinomycetota bacterium]